MCHSEVWSLFGLSCFHHLLLIFYCSFSITHYSLLVDPTLIVSIWPSFLSFPILITQNIVNEWWELRTAFWCFQILSYELSDILVITYDECDPHYTYLSRYQWLFLSFLFTPFFFSQLCSLLSFFISPISYIGIWVADLGICMLMCLDLDGCIGAVVVWGLDCDGGGFVWPFVTFSFCGCGWSCGWVWLINAFFFFGSCELLRLFAICGLQVSLLWRVAVFDTSPTN